MNDSLTYMLPRYEKVKISLGVLTQIRINDHNRISTSDTRIIRRMVRDQQFRDRGPDKGSVHYAEARRLLRFLKPFKGIDSSVVPPNSLLREFIGPDRKK